MIRPPPGCAGWVLLRRNDDNFVGYVDDGSVVAASNEGDDPVQVLDWEGLTDNMPCYYRVYYSDGGSWLPSGPAVAVTPRYQASPGFHIPDVATTIRNRLIPGLAAELALGNIEHSNGAIQVLVAPPLVDQVAFPVVTVQLETRTSAERGIGEEIIGDYFVSSDELWNCFEGWLDRSTVRITAWTLNPDGRIRLREAIQRILMANLPVFAAAGFLQIDLQQSDSADFQSFNAPVYQAVIDFTCLHPALVREQLTPIRQLEVHPHAQDA